MITINTYSTLEHQKWNQIVESMINYDFYSMCSYHKIAESRNEGIAILFVFKDDQVTICIPLLIRPIENTDFFDATSVYGYSGPLSSKLIIDQESIQNFQQHLNAFFDKHKVISVFSRLNPLLDSQINILKGLGDLESHGSTVSIDLSLNGDEQRSQYRKSTKSELNRLKKLGLTIVKDNNLDNLDDFIDIYHQNMKRVKASDSYFFDNNYFRSLLTPSDYKTELLFSQIDGKNICGSIFCFSKDIIQYHLSGTLTDYVEISPTRMLIDYIRTENTFGRYKYLHLGGGIGGSNEDSLFKFKSGFSKIRNQFYVWKYIVKQDLYQNLVSKTLSIKNPNFFPLYRSY